MKVLTRVAELCSEKGVADEVEEARVVWEKRVCEGVYRQGVSEMASVFPGVKDNS